VREGEENTEEENMKNDGVDLGGVFFAGAAL